MNRGYFYLGLISILMLLTVSVMAMNVSIFTDSQHQVDVGRSQKNYLVNCYNLDQLQIIINKMNQAVSGQNPQVATVVAKSFMRRHKAMISHAVDGVRYSQKYDITTVPTIVFDDGLYQIKGQYDLTAAIREYEEWKRKNDKN